MSTPTVASLPRFSINAEVRPSAARLDKPHHTDPQFESYVGFDDDLIALEKYFTWQSDLERAKAYTPLLNKYYEPSIYRQEDVSGEETLLKVKQTVRGFFPKGRFPFQRNLHNQILRATLKQTLGDDYDRCVNRVCEENGWDGPKRNLIAIASRRSGKTTATASMVASLLVNIVGIEIVVYSVGLRSAQEFVRLTERYIQMHDTGRDMIKNPGGSETLVLRGKNPGDMRRIRSFPSGGNAKNLSKNAHTEMQQEPQQDVEMPDVGVQSMLEAVNQAEHSKGEVEDVESTEEVIPLLDEFDIGLPNIGLHQLETYLLDFEAKLRPLLESLGPGRVPKGYVGRQLMVSVLGHVGRLVSELLSKKFNQHLDSDDGLDFAMELAAILYPRKWGIPTYDITVYDELLKPGGNANGPVIRRQAADELREKAKKRILEIEKAAFELETEEQKLAYMDNNSLEYAHLHQVGGGIYPAPFNAVDKHRWLPVDITRALDPTVDTREVFRLSSLNVAFLKQAAEIIYDSYKQSPATVAQDPKAVHHIQTVEDFLQYGRLREPWHIGEH